MVCASEALAAAARELGAREVRVVPSGVAVPETVVGARGAAARPLRRPALRGEGRRGAARGDRRPCRASIVGDGPLRARVPDAVGFVPPGELGPYFERAAVVVCPSRREGYGVVAREAMAYGRPVVASAVGGLVDAVEDGVTGLLVPARDPAALRSALERLLADSELRARLGEAARERARERFSWEAATRAALDAYAAATDRGLSHELQRPTPVVTPTTALATT